MHRWIVSAWIVAAMGCQSVPRTTPAFEHLDECVDPTLESMSWHPIEGQLVEVLSSKSFVMRTATGTTVQVTLANVDDGVGDAGAAALKALLAGGRVTVLTNQSGKSVEGEVQNDKGIDVARRLLSEGLVKFKAAKAYTLSAYSECLHKIAEREARAGHLGIWGNEKTLGDYECPAPAIGVVAGVVTTPERKPIPGASVRLLASEDLTIQVLTDEHGEFVIPCLYPGPGFEIEVEAAGFRTAKRTFEVDKSNLTRLSIVAEPK